MSNKPNATSFTAAYPGLSNVLKADVKISKSSKNYNTKFEKCVSLWDTGATITVITKKVVDALQLKPVSMSDAHTPQGTYSAYLYYIDLLLPNNVRFPKLLVMEGMPAGCDLLIGMDVIGKGDFAVSNYNGITKFTYRFPSVGEMDFVKNTYFQPIIKKAFENAPAKNAKCPCGSGKKYKQCCGKT